MTVIAYKDGVIAADSRCTYDSDTAGTQVFKCEKLFRKVVPTLDGTGQEEVILATQGETFSGMVFVDWFGTGKEMPEILIHGDAEFTVLILRKDGLYEVDRWCRPIRILEEFYAIGSGSKAAMAAMIMGASAVRAIEVACTLDPYCAPPIITMSLMKAKPKRPRKPKLTHAVTPGDPLSKLAG